jgi:hypothetical protein
MTVSDGRILAADGAPWERVSAPELFDLRAQIGHDCAHIGHEGRFASIPSKKPGGCAVHQDTAARPRCVFRPAGT